MTTIHTRQLQRIHTRQLLRIHTRQLTTIHTRHLKIQHVQNLNNTKVRKYYTKGKQHQGKKGMFPCSHSLYLSFFVIRWIFFSPFRLLLSLLSGQCYLILYNYDNNITVQRDVSFHLQLLEGFKISFFFVNEKSGELSCQPKRISVLVHGYYSCSHLRQ